jgi:hypothetical protein
MVAMALPCGAPALAGPPATAAPAVTLPRIVEDCRRDPSEIVVCSRPTQLSPYRLPPQEGFDPDGPIDSVSRERHRLMDVGAVGIGSCSTVGPGGWTGCDAIQWKEQHQQKDGNARVWFGVKPRNGDF